jgi:hypothetical protein
MFLLFKNLYICTRAILLIQLKEVDSLSIFGIGDSKS